MMQTPNFKLMLMYDIRSETMDNYYYYVLKEFVPELESMGLFMFRAWHIAYGNYPMRQLEFVTEKLETIREVFESERWQKLENELQTYTTSYSRKLVRFRNGYQF